MQELIVTLNGPMNNQVYLNGKFTVSMGSDKPDYTLQNNRINTANTGIEAGCSWYQ